ncbi:MAG: Ig-like domain-containing protein [Nitrospirae bacterium]|nr:Ig-like domain-containing protein [Nitrospirota bacterium]
MKRGIKIVLALSLYSIMSVAFMSCVSGTGKLVSIAVTPADPVLKEGTTQQFVATAKYENSTTSDITAQVTWSLSDTSVATITNGGLATAVSGGTTVVIAVLGSVAGSTTLTVTSSSAFPVGSNPTGIAIDSSGNAWVTNSGDNTVTELSSSGTALGTFTVGTAPFGIAVSSSGNVWVTNYGTAAVPGTTVTELSSSGTTLGTFAVENNPAGIAIDSSGNVWVANYGSNTVTVWKSASTGG